MNENTDRKFEPMCGTGTLRAKPTPHAVIRTGVISIPGYGQCYIDGHHSKLETNAVLDVKSNATRKVVAQLQLPVGNAPVLEGRIVTVGRGRRRETWTLQATLRQGEAGPYRALRLPDVKIATEEMDRMRAERGEAPRSKYTVA
jgi:hypothetical protein